MCAYGENVVGSYADAGGRQRGTEPQGTGVHEPDADVGQHYSGHHDEPGRVDAQRGLSGNSKTILNTKTGRGRDVINKTPKQSKTKREHSFTCSSPNNSSTRMPILPSVPADEPHRPAQTAYAAFFSRRWRSVGGSASVCGSSGARRPALRRSERAAVSSVAVVMAAARLTRSTTRTATSRSAGAVGPRRENPIPRHVLRRFRRYGRESADARVCRRSRSTCDRNRGGVARRDPWIARERRAVYRSTSKSRDPERTWILSDYPRARRVITSRGKTPLSPCGRETRWKRSAICTRNDDDDNAPRLLAGPG